MFERYQVAMIVVDVESDGPIPGDYSMVSLGAVLVGSESEKTFFGKLKPVSDKWVPGALPVSGYSREETETFDEPKLVMEKFAEWLAGNSRSRLFF